MASYESADLDLTDGAGIYDPLLGTGGPPAPAALGATPLLPTPVSADPFAAFGAPPVVAPPAPAPAARPAWLPAKFASVEAMAASYAALEARLGSGAPAAPTAPGVAPADAAGILGVPPGAPAPVQVPQTPDVWAEAEKAMAAPGGLTDEVRARIVAAGVPASVLAGVEKAQAFAMQAGQHTIQQMFGGPAGYAEMAKQAAAVLTPAEKAAVNTQLNSGDFQTMLLGAQWLQSRLAAQSTAGFVSPTGAIQGRSAHTPFTEIEMDAAVRDKRYGVDPLYMQQYNARYEATQRAGGFRQP